MNEPKTKKILQDVLMLLRKYSRKDVERAIASLKSRSTPDALIKKAKRQALADYKRKNARKKVLPRTPVDFETKVANRHEGGAARFESDILQKKILLTTAELREFCMALNVKVPAKATRATIGKMIGARLNELPAVDRDRVMSAARSERSSLQAWTDIIVKDITAR